MELQPRIQPYYSEAIKTVVGGAFGGIIAQSNSSPIGDLVADTAVLFMAVGLFWIVNRMTVSSDEDEAEDESSNERIPRVAS